MPAARSRCSFGPIGKRRGTRRYQVRFYNERGQRSQQPILHNIEVLRDLAARGADSAAGEVARVEVPEDGEQTIEVRAVDPDFGLVEAVRSRGLGRRQAAAQHRFARRRRQAAAAGRRSLCFSPARARIEGRRRVEVRRRCGGQSHQSANRASPSRTSRGRRNTRSSSLRRCRTILPRAIRISSKSLASPQNKQGKAASAPPKPDAKGADKKQNPPAADQKNSQQPRQPDQKDQQQKKTDGGQGQPRKSRRPEEQTRAGGQAAEGRTRAREGTESARAGEGTRERTGARATARRQSAGASATRKNAGRRAIRLATRQAPAGQSARRQLGEGHSAGGSQEQGQPQRRLSRRERQSTQCWRPGLGRSPTAFRSTR